MKSQIFVIFRLSSSPLLCFLGIYLSWSNLCLILGKSLANSSSFDERFLLIFTFVFLHFLNQFLTPIVWKLNSWSWISYLHVYSKEIHSCFWTRCSLVVYWRLWTHLHHEALNFSSLVFTSLFIGISSLVWKEQSLDERSGNNLVI